MNALLQQERPKIGHLAMERLLDTAPYLARCSDNKSAALVRPRDYAIHWPYMQVNRPNLVSWLVFDIDHNNPNIWEDANLPAPNFIVRDREKNTSHLYYAIVPVSTSDKSRSKPIQFMKRVYQAMSRALKSDTSYAGTVAKTPHHPKWITTEFHGYEYELGELAAHVEIEYTPYWTTKEEVDNSHSRNCTLFDEVRHFAKTIVLQAREESHYEAFRARLEQYAEMRNDFALRGFSAGNLRYSEIKATVKSVARWTWDNYVCQDCENRGIMNLDKSLSIEERQSLAAKRTHTERKSSTTKRIVAVTQHLIKQNKKVTQTAIAKLAKLSRQTVSKYQSLINTLVAEPSIIPFASLFRAKKIVNYAVSDICPPAASFEHEVSQKPRQAPVALFQQRNQPKEE